MHLPRYIYFGVVILAIVVATVAFSYSTEEALTNVVVGQFGGVNMAIEHAVSDIERERGLSGRESIPDNYGMLFTFAEDGLHGFWMKDMLIPIDIFWLDSQGHVVSLVESADPSTFPHVFYPNVPARYVLETVSGFAQRHVIATGTPLLLKNFVNVSK